MWINKPKRYNGDSILYDTSIVYDSPAYFYDGKSVTLWVNGSKIPSNWINKTTGGDIFLDTEDSLTLTTEDNDLIILEQQQGDTIWTNKIKN